MVSISSFANVLYRLLVYMGAFIYLFVAFMISLIVMNVKTDTRWETYWLIKWTSRTHGKIKLTVNEMAALEAAYYSAFAALAHFYKYPKFKRSTGPKTKDDIINYVIDSLRATNKYSWVLYIPWLLGYGRNFFRSIIDMVMMLSTTQMLEADNMMSCMIALGLYFFLQAVLGSEVLIMTLEGWFEMKILDEEVEDLYDKSRIIFGDEGDPVLEKFRKKKPLLSRFSHFLQFPPFIWFKK